MESSPLIGIFDSGVGGFSVYRKIKDITSANSIYYGDCLNAPYGNKEEAELRELIKNDIIFLQEKGATHYVNACNSMSVMMTDTLLSECSVDPSKYTDMIRAFTLRANFNKNEVVLVIATVATIRSGVYKQVLQDKGVEVLEFAYEDLALAIEKNESKEKCMEIVERSILYAKERGATTIVYGCTHYPLIHAMFVECGQKHSWSGEFVDPAVFVAQVVKAWNLEGERTFCPYASKDTPAFINNIISFL